MNGYTKIHPVGIEVRADMLESVAGYDERALNKELAFAVGSLDLDDADSMRWLSTLMARRIEEIGEGIAKESVNLLEPQ